MRLDGREQKASGDRYNLIEGLKLKPAKPDVTPNVRVLSAATPC